MSGDNNNNNSSNSNGSGRREGLEEDVENEEDLDIRMLKVCVHDNIRRDERARELAGWPRVAPPSLIKPNEPNM